MQPLWKGSALTIDLPRDRVGKFSSYKGLDSAVRLPPEPVELSRDDVQALADAIPTPDNTEVRVEGIPGAYTAYIMVAADMPRETYLDPRSRVASRKYKPEYHALQLRLRDLPDVKFASVIRAPEVEVQAERTSHPYAYQGRSVVDIELTSDRGAFTARVPSTREDDAVQWLAQTGQFPVLERVVGRAEAGRLIRAASADAPASDDGLF